MYRLAEQVIGDVPAFLAEERSKGISFRAIAAKLVNQGIPTNQGTVSNWCRRSGIA